MGGTQPQPMPMQLNWHAIFTRHQFERSVAASLSSKGHEVYLPLYRSLRQWQDRTKHLWLPLFPGYVFIRAGLDRQFQGSRLLTGHGISLDPRNCPVSLGRPQTPELKVS